MPYNVPFPPDGKHELHLAKLRDAFKNFTPPVQVWPTAARDEAIVDGKGHPDEDIEAIIYLFVPSAKR